MEALNSTGTSSLWPLVSLRSPSVSAGASTGSTSTFKVTDNNHLKNNLNNNLKFEKDSPFYF